MVTRRRRVPPIQIELAQIGNHHIGAIPDERRGVRRPVDPDDKAGARGLARLNPGDAILEHHASAHLGMEKLGRLQIGVGRGFAGQTHGRRLAAADHDVEQIE
jgi:hypothetical protein